MRRCRASGRSSSRRWSARESLAAVRTPARRSRLARLWCSAAPVETRREELVMNMEREDGRESGYKLILISFRRKKWKKAASLNDDLITSHL